MTPYADCETCWGVGRVYRLPCRWVWVPYKQRYIESSFIRCPDCNAEVAGA